MVSAADVSALLWGRDRKLAVTGTLSDKTWLCYCDWTSHTFHNAKLKIHTSFFFKHIKNTKYTEEKDIIPDVVRQHFHYPDRIGDDTERESNNTKNKSNYHYCFTSGDDGLHSWNNMINTFALTVVIDPYCLHRQKSKPTTQH